MRYSAGFLEQCRLFGTVQALCNSELQCRLSCGFESLQVANFCRLQTPETKKKPAKINIGKFKKNVEK